MAPATAPTTATEALHPEPTGTGHDAGVAYPDAGALDPFGHGHPVAEADGPHLGEADELRSDPFSPSIRRHEVDGKSVVHPLNMRCEVTQIGPDALTGRSHPSAHLDTSDGEPSDADADAGP